MSTLFVVSKERGEPSILLSVCAYDTTRRDEQDLEQPAVLESILRCWALGVLHIDVKSNFFED